jgi:hypothetical protein
VLFVHLCVCDNRLTFCLLQGTNTDSYKTRNNNNNNSNNRPYEQDSDVINPLVQQATSSSSISSPRGVIDNSVHHNDVNLKVFAFYQKYNPSKLDDVPMILEKYKGKEGDLLAKLKKQYGVTDF